VYAFTINKHDNYQSLAKTELAVHHLYSRLHKLWAVLSLVRIQKQHGLNKGQLKPRKEK